MTIRADMAAACQHVTIGFDTICTGRVRLKLEHLDAAASLADLLSEARIGCCQKCGCLLAFAEFADGPDGIYVAARGGRGPGELELGHRDAPEPDGAP